MGVFTDFFYLLRERGIPVSLHEWLAFQEALAKGLANGSLVNFYYLARATLVKSETLFDRFDRAFLEYFGDIEVPEAIIEEVLKGLKEVPELEISEAEKEAFEDLDLEEVRRRFEEQLREGNYHGHVGGDRAIGTGGRSTQGAFGFHKQGVRIGQGRSRLNRAIQIAERRAFRNYDRNAILDTRSIQIALSRLRTLLPLGEKDEVDVEATIQETCKNAGELELVFRRRMENSVKVILLMDTGGSMEPYVSLVERLFSAAAAQFDHLHAFYFHNCIYQDLWKDVERGESIPTEDFLRAHDPLHKLIIVGDASMAPSELLEPNGAIDYFYYNEIPGLVWLKRLREHFQRSIWLNPLRSSTWPYVRTVQMIREIFPMFELSLEGIEEGIKYLLRGS